MEAQDIPGIKKAAILLLTMDEEISKEVIKDLEEEDIEAIGKEIAQLKIIPDNAVATVRDEFMRRLSKRGNRVVGGENKFKELIKKSFSNEQAEQFLENMETKKGLPGDFLRRCDPKVLANIMKGEHPQTIALVLSTLGNKKAGEAIVALPEKVQSDVIVRMAFLEKVDTKVLEEIENVLREQLESIGVVEGRQLGGVEMVAGILNQMDRTHESELLEKLEEIEPELAERIKQLMFTFEDLVQLDDKSVQALLKEISSDEISVALKGASDMMKDKIFSNMSERAAAMLKEDIEAMGPIRLSDVEKAQTKIAMIAKKLESEGKIVLSRGNEKFV
ncbi:MAG TPA: flagellar motor switch protein FliG [Syntrophorhabdus sp.]|jgi:flagellar motor switch protein FliG|nr:flagellar motor switch protein FliG [Syntrophorhabdus sp.]OPX94411.1 MAG: Flagellar motor switch protein FliG [Syntrophorhabdus sp. PtaB.Bin027]OQB78018.1 MAG: Flagellar motor switch protein FliG [Deltaproteobacteria bacterium ADurb.Bin135]MBP8743696.1 flagellar motor switch protein FliG [Syntrophorhabdus sp.]NMC93611.1 flagellar motor switch protein FliG [Syntrophorhabdus sp.]